MHLHVEHRRRVDDLGDLLLLLVFGGEGRGAAGKDPFVDLLRRHGDHVPHDVEALEAPRLGDRLDPVLDVELLPGARAHLQDLLLVLLEIHSEELVECQRLRIDLALAAGATLNVPWIQAGLGDADVGWSAVVGLEVDALPGEFRGRDYCVRLEGSPTAAPAHMLFTDVSAGAGYSCGVTFSGSLHCWGLGPTAPDLSWAAVEATTVHACGIKADRSLSCWGTETFDRIAHPEGGRYQMVDTSQLHSCALAYDGSIDCWGHEQFDQNIVPECP